MAIRLPDFTDTISDDLSGISQNTAASSKQLGDIYKVLSDNFLKEMNSMSKGVESSLKGVKDTITTRAKQEDKIRADENRAQQKKDVENKRAREVQTGFLQHLKNKSDEQTAVQKAMKTSQEIWHSQMLANIRNIIDEQQKAYRRMGESRGLTHEETKALIGDINNIRKQINVKGGYLFSDEQVRMAVEKLAKAGFSDRAQREYAGITAKFGVAFGDMSDRMLQGMKEFDILTKSWTKEQREQSMEAIGGAMTQAAKAMGMTAQRGQMLESVFSEEALIRAQNITGEAQSALELLKATAVGQTAAEKVGLGGIYEKYASRIMDIAAKGDIESNAEMIDALREFSKGNKEYAGLLPGQFAQMVKSDPAFLQKITIDMMRSIATGGAAGAELSKIFGADIKDIERVRANLTPENEKILTDALTKGNEVLKEPLDKQAQYLNDLLIEYQKNRSILENIKTYVENALASTGLAGSMMGIGTFAELTVIYRGISDIVKFFGKRAVDAGDKGGEAAAEAAAKSGIGLSRFGKGVKIAGKGLMYGEALYDITTGLSSYSTAQTREEKMAGGAKALGAGGMLAGAAFGAKAGAGAGSFVGPVGTFIGGAIGGVLGGLLGEEFVRSISEPIVEELQPVLDEISPYFKKISDFFSNAWGKVKNFFGNLFDYFKTQFGKDLGEGIAYGINTLKQVPYYLEGTLNVLYMKWLEVVKFFETIPEKMELFMVDLTKKMNDSAIGRRILGFMGFESTGERLDEALQQKQVEINQRMAEKTADADVEMARAVSSIASSLAQIENLNKGYEERQAARTKGSPDGSHANGLPVVPYDGYLAELHFGESVLTKEEAEKYRALKSSMYFDLFSDMASNKKALNQTWNTRRNAVNSQFLSMFEAALGSNAVMDWASQNGIDGIIMISGLRTPAQQAQHFKGGYGSFNSAHLLGKALDFNLVKEGKTLRAFVGDRAANVVDPENEQYYVGFGEALQKSNSYLRSGALFTKQDPNHVEMALTAADYENLKALNQKYMASQPGATALDTAAIPAIQNAVRQGAAEGTAMGVRMAERKESLPEQNMAESRMARNNRVTGYATA